MASRSLTKEELLERLAEAEQHAARLEDEKRKTTLFEYIISCHQLVFFQASGPGKQTSYHKGDHSRAAQQMVSQQPPALADFIEQQRFVAGVLVEAFPPPLQARVFEPNVL
jgi:hypothetical protein